MTRVERHGPLQGMRFGLCGALGTAVLAMLACTDRHDEGVARTRSSVELSGRDQRVFALVTSGLTERTFDARAREWAAMATGSDALPR